MSNASKGNFGNNLTAVLVAVIGAISAIGGAWITVYGPSSANQTQAAAVTASKDTTQGTTPADQPGTPGAPTSASPQAVAQELVAPAAQPAAPAAQPAAPVYLPNSRQIPYNQPWPNKSKVNSLILEAVEVTDQVVRVHLRFDNASGSPVKFYTSTSGQGIRSYLSGKKDTQYPATGTGGELFANPNVVEIPAGARKQGWIEYQISGKKTESLNFYLESYTEGYPAGQSGSIAYEPLKFKIEN